jgi:hypothetical protein
MANPEISQQRAPIKDRFLAVMDNILHIGSVYRDMYGSIIFVTHKRRSKEIVCLYSHDENNTKRLESRTVKKTELPTVQIQKRRLDFDDLSQW